MSSLVRSNIVFALAGMVLTTLVIVISFSSANNLEQRLTLESHAQFIELSHEVERKIEGRIRVYANALYGAQALFAASKGVEEEEWAAYVSGLDLPQHYPGILSFSYVAYQSSATGTEQAINRYLEPSTYRSYKGFDLLSEPTRRAALLTARDMGTPVMTAPLELLTGDRGFLLVAPIYQNGQPHTTLAERRRALQGYVVETLRSPDVFSAVAGIGTDESSMKISVKDEGRVVYQSSTRSSSRLPSRIFGRSVFPFAGRRWEIELRPTDQLWQTQGNRHAPALIRWGGVLLSLMLSGLFLSLVTARRRALALAERMTQDLKRQEQQLSTVLESLPVGVLVVDAPKGQINLANQAALGLLGKAILQKGETPYPLVHEDGTPYPPEALPVNKTLTNGEPAQQQDIFILQPDGHKINTRGSSVPLRNAQGQIYGVIAVIEDITREREIDKMKSEFVSVASHQLRTPLTGIKWFAELLLKGKAGEVTKDQKDFVEQIYESNNRMIALVEDLLNVSRIETGRKFSIVKQPTDLIPLLRAIETDLIGLAKKRNITLVVNKTFPKTLALNVDGAKIQQVWQNLLSNAMKYSRQDGSVWVNAEASGEEMRFSVRDQGLGIPKEQQHRIFEKFFRASNVQTAETDGNGLGLYIVKAIVEGHGGRIWFESEEGKGTTFFFALPKT